MSDHAPGKHRSLSERLRIIHRSTKKTAPSKDKKGVRVKKKKFSPFAALRILIGPSK